MKKRRTVRRTAVALVLGGLLAATGCHGPFYLTRTIHQWNGKIQGTQDIPGTGEV